MKTDVYLEVGGKRTFAVAVEWPGWSRGGKDKDLALQALLDYGERYGAAIKTARLGFEPPQSTATFKVVERLKGDTATDFGTPGSVPAADKRPVDEGELRRLQAILKACWKAFDAITARAEGKVLRLGPRGGGRSREKIMEHVAGAEHAYLTKLGMKWPLLESEPVEVQLQEYRKGVLNGMVASAHGELPKQGPRGGLYWPVRYFARRSAWHVLDHAWEIEDRLEQA